MSFKKSFLFSLLFAVPLLYGFDGLIDSPYEQGVRDGSYNLKKSSDEQMRDEKIKLNSEKWLFLIGTAEERTNYFANGNPSEYFKILYFLPISQVQARLASQYREEQARVDAEIEAFIKQKQEEERMALESEEQETSDGQSFDHGWLYENFEDLVVDTVNADNTPILGQDYKQHTTGKAVPSHKNKKQFPLKTKKEFITAVRKYAKELTNIKNASDSILEIFYDTTYKLDQFHSISKIINPYVYYLNKFLDYFKSSGVGFKDSLTSFMEKNSLENLLNNYKKNKRLSL